MVDQNLIDQSYEDYDFYSAYRAELVSGEQKVSEGLDKAVLTISSAALGLIFTIFDKLYTGADVSSLGNFRWSWIFLCGSVLFVLLSLSLSGYLYRRNLLQVDKILSNRIEIIRAQQVGIQTGPDKEDFKPSFFVDRFARLSHYLGSILLFLGLFSFGLFVDKNLDGYKKIEVKDELVQTFIDHCAGRKEEISSPAATSASISSPTKEKIIDEPSTERREKSCPTTAPKTNKTSEEKVKDIQALNVSTLNNS